MASFPAGYMQAQSLIMEDIRRMEAKRADALKEQARAREEQENKKGFDWSICHIDREKCRADDRYVNNSRTCNIYHGNDGLSNDLQLRPGENFNDFKFISIEPRWEPRQRVRARQRYYEKKWGGQPVEEKSRYLVRKVSWEHRNEARQIVDQAEFEAQK